MNAAERAEKEDLLKRINIAVIKGKLDEYIELPEEEKPVFEVKITKLCLRYQKIKKELEEK